MFTTPARRHPECPFCHVLYVRRCSISRIFVHQGNESRVECFVSSVLGFLIDVVGRGRGLARIIHFMHKVEPSLSLVAYVPGHVSVVSGRRDIQGDVEVRLQMMVL